MTTLFQRVGIVLVALFVLGFPGQASADTCLNTSTTCELSGETVPQTCTTCTASSTSSGKSYSCQVCDPSTSHSQRSKIAKARAGKACSAGSETACNQAFGGNRTSGGIDGTTKNGTHSDHDGLCGPIDESLGLC